jgi:hypothetical protein
MKAGTSRLMSMSQAAIGSLRTPASDVRIEVESADAPPETAEDEQPPVVVAISMLSSLPLGRRDPRSK